MRAYSPHLLPKIRSEHIRNGIGGKLPDVPQFPCTLRIASLIPGGTCSEGRTVIPAHFGDLGKGMSTKVSDIDVVAACFTCHDILDRRDSRWRFLKENHEVDVLRRLIAAGSETRAMLLFYGLIEVEGAKLLKGYV